MEMNKLCRLCMGSEESEVLMDITLDGDNNLSIKTASCIGIQISSNDGLPSQICMACKETVTIFFYFKQKCLEVDLKLRALASSALLNKNLDICSQKPSQNIKVSDLETAKSNVNNVYSTKKRHNSVPKKKIQCEICGKIFQIKAALENHVITHSGLKPYPCKLCPKRYCRIESLTIHMRSHAGIKPYVCEICGKTSTKRQDLIRHMKIHSEERNYHCSRCNRHFKRASDVTSHIRTHKGLRPYRCETCKKNLHIAQWLAETL